MDRVKARIKPYLLGNTLVESRSRNNQDH
jgi:hypothetical protein